MTIKYTPTQKRMLKLFSDGKFHARDEVLFACIGKAVRSTPVLRFHIHCLRKKIRPMNQDIIWQYGEDGKTYYKHIMDAGSIYL